MDTEVEDVKAVGAESSTTPPDATEASSTSTTTTAESSTAGDKEPKSIAEALDSVSLEQPAEGAADKDQQAGESPTTEKPESSQAKADESAGEQDKPPGEESKAADLDVPFHTRPEWQKAMAEIKKLPQGAETIKPILREAFQRETRANEQVRALEPLAKSTRELREIVGGETEFNTMRELVRGFASGDPKVIPILEQMVKSIKQSSGEILSSSDLVTRETNLREQYDQGLIDQNEFQTQTNLLKEVEKNRAQAKGATQRLQQTQQTQEQQAAQAVERQAVETINSWENNIRQRDPDFGNVTDPDDPKHGESMADQVYDAMVLQRIQRPNATTDDLLKAAQKAYDRAKSTGARPAMRQQRVVTSQSSSITGKQKPRTMREAMDSVKLEGD